jgi:ankyrin repeat protein
MKILINTLFLFLLFSIQACGQRNRSVDAFKNTEAYELAQAVSNEDLAKIEQLVEQNPKLLTVVSAYGSNVLTLCLYIGNFASFKRVLELGANPNSINPYTKYSVLIEACKPFGNSSEWIKDNRYAELLLIKGANPNYAVEQDFTNEEGVNVSATSPMFRASRLDLELVKMLVRFGADYEKRIGGTTPFAQAVTFKRFTIINYYIDSLKVDPKAPLTIGTADSLFVQDYINKFMAYQLGTEGYELKQKLIKRLEAKGVDFKNHKYKL